MDARTLGEVIRSQRLETGVSLRSLAKDLSVTPSYLSDIENDRRVPAESVVKRIADVLGLDFDDLMARGGRLGEQAERYLRQQPLAGLLLREIARHRLTEAELQGLIRAVKALGQKRKE
jgi:transcriptional regulator with XRE-family HTH domain